MSDKITVSLASNAGVLIQIGSTKILLDAIWRQSEAYSPPPAGIRAQMLTGDNKWRNVDYLIFTHLHNDHFEQNAVIEYLQHNKVKNIWFEPQVEVEDTALLQNYLQQNHIAHQQFALKRDTYKTVQLTDNIAITALCTQHMGVHSQQDHLAIVLHSRDKHLLFVTDAEFPSDVFSQALAGLKLDAVFINPVHFYSKSVLKMITENLNVKQIVVYHLPFEGEGNSVFRRMVAKKLTHIQQSIPISLLWNIGDCLEI